MSKIVLTMLLLASTGGVAVAVRDEWPGGPALAAWIEEVAPPSLAAAMPTAREPEPEYLTARLEKGIVDRTISATGALTAVVTVELGSQLSGEIAKVLVDFNDRVKQGQPLAQIDERSFVGRVDEARAALATAHANVKMQRAKLERAQIDYRDAEAQRAVLQARLDNTKIRLDAAERDLQRKLSLKLREAASTATVEESQTQTASAAAAVREAQAVLAAHDFTVAGAAADLRRLDAELAFALATVPQREAILSIAQVDLERTTIRSPISGVVVGRLVNEGQTIASGLEARTIFVIARDLREMEIHARVDETDIGRIKSGQRATFTVDAYPGRRFYAVVRQVRQSAQVVQNVVTYTVVLSTSNSEELLLPGMTALARIVVDQTGPVLTMPLAALRFSPRGAPAGETTGEPGNQSAPIWLRSSDGTLRATQVKTGLDDSTRVAVLDGPVAEGDEVVVGEASRPPRRQLFGIRLGF